MDNRAAVQELHEALNDMGDYTMTATDFVNSVENMRMSGKYGGRGRGIARPPAQDSLAEVRLAAQANRLQPKAVPIGQLATTEDTLARSFDAEITVGLRAMGIYGADGALRSDRTRRTVIDQEDIRVDGNFPVILNRDLFQQSPVEEVEDETNTVPPSTPEAYDPAVPLALQFTTITELQRSPNTSPSNDRLRPNQKPSPAGKGKKTKWRKMRHDELVDTEQSRGRYDVGGPIGPGVPFGRYSRDVVGEEGVKYLQ